MTQTTTIQEQNVRTIEGFYAAYLKGDVDTILAGLTNDVQWTARLDPIVPWSGEFSGIANVPAFFKSISDSVEVLAFEPGEYIAQGDTVVSLGYFACRSLVTGKSARVKWIFVWKFQGGKVSSYEQFSEPALADPFRA